METKTTQNSLEIAKKVNEIVSKSGVAFELDITEACELAERAKAITSISDEGFNEIKREMQKYRKYTNEYFLSARSEFNRMAKGVIEVEKLVIAQFVDEENRLIELDKAEKARIKEEARKASLPDKRERLDANGIEMTDEEILAMEDADFELEFARRLSEKALREAEEARIEREQEHARMQAEKDRIAEDKARLEREKQEMIDAEARRKQEEIDRMARLKQEEEDRQSRIAQEEIDRKARIAQEEADRKAHIEEEARQAEEAEKARLADERYQNWLKANNYNEETDIIVDNVLYRKVSVYESNI